MTVYNLYRDIIFIKKKKKKTRTFLLCISPSNTKFLSSLNTRDGKGRIAEGLSRGTPAVIYVRPIFSAIFPWIYGLLIL